MIHKIKTMKTKLNQISYIAQEVEELRYAIGSMRADAIHAGDPVREFKVFSQSGEDGVIQWLIKNIRVSSERFIEFGVQNYTEANTRFLLMHDNWSGLIMDGSKENIDYARHDHVCWMHDLTPVHAFITAENINELIRENGFSGDIGILSVVIDGMDYWVWRAIDCIIPDIVICEYNSRFGAERAVTLPYDASFYRTKAHYSNLYFGASIRAMVQLGDEKGYALVYGNKIGSNLFFVRRELLNDVVRERSVEECYIRAKYRQARRQDGELALLTVKEEEKLLENDKLLLVEV